MTEYRNPRLPEGINNSETRPFRQFLWLTTGVLGLLVLGLIGLGLAAQWLASRVPFEYEVGLAAPFVDELVEEAGPTDPRIEAYLQGLADRLAPAMGIENDMPITLHYSPDETVNAMATLGGHLVVYRGLIERMGSENALAMVIGHEIAHVLHRDPIVSLGRGVAVAVALGAVAGVSSNDIAARAIGEAGLLTSLSFSREQERDADSAGLRGVAAVYGHASGALDLYRSVAGDAGPASKMYLDFFDTHPDSGRRIQTIEAEARANGWALDAAPTPLPDWLPAALAASRPKSDQPYRAGAESGGE
jgi:beta-barrel assembly-enhancing protease